MENSMNRRPAWEIFKQALMQFFVSVLVALAIELLNQRSFANLLQFICECPLMFVFNVFIVFNTFMFAELWQRRNAWRCFVLFLWLALGIANYMIVTDRVFPFTTRDFIMIPDGMKMITAYFTWPQIILLFLGIALWLGILIYPFCRKLKTRRRFSRMAAFSTFAIVTAVTLLAGKFSVEMGLIDWEHTSLTEAYRNYGFAYGFTYTFADFGIRRPDEYTEAFVEEIVEEIADPQEELIIEPENTVQPEEIPEITPNIVVVQVESFFDVNNIIGAEYSENPIPNYTRLKQEWPSGAFRVPTIGGGTANTEFEVLTGMNRDYFAAGEIPYTTILGDTTCESLCYNLKPLGYTATALHTYTGTFYSRDTVYPKLGFDRFVSQEYMNDLEYTQTGWAMDTALIREILQAMETTQGDDFVFAVTVQSHGKFPTEPVEGLDEISVLACPDRVNAAQLTNFVNELHSVDQFLRGLTEALAAFDEPTVLVLYGDHLPGIGLEDEDMAVGDVYQTDYIVWNNFGMAFDAPDLEAYRLGAELLRQLGIHNGVLTHYHQGVDIDEESEQYLALLRVLEYDMLYGDHVIYEGENPYVETQMQMGSVQISVTGADYQRTTGTLTVTGENFTPFSDVILNGTRQKAVFVDENTLLIKTSIASGDSICVGQFSLNGDELGRTDPILYKN